MFICSLSTNHCIWEPLAVAGWDFFAPVAYLIVSCVLYWRFLKPISPAGFYDGILSLAADLLPTSCRSVRVWCKTSRARAESSFKTKHNISNYVWSEIQVLIHALVEISQFSQQEESSQTYLFRDEGAFRLRVKQVKGFAAWPTSWCVVAQEDWH